MSEIVQNAQAPTVLDIEAVEAAMLKLPQANCPVRHYFAPGVCLREVTMPAGALVIGHAHKSESMNLMLKGRALLYLPDGSKQEVAAPFIAVTAPGRKAAYILEETVWVNVLATNETDPAVIEEIFVQKSEAYRAHKEESLCLS